MNLSEKTIRNKTPKGGSDDEYANQPQHSGDERSPEYLERPE
jgi:hypothetical protein